MTEPSGVACDPPAQLSAAKVAYWNLLREVVVHEDDLVNHRVTWLLAVQAFIIGGFFVIQGQLLDLKAHVHAIAVIEAVLAIALAGASWICYIAGCTISAAYAQIGFAKEAWLKRYGDSEGRHTHRIPTWINWFRRNAHVRPDDFPAAAQLPTLAGTYNFMWYVSTQSIALIMLIINVAMMTVSITVVYLCLSNPNLVNEITGRPPAANAKEVEGEPSHMREARHRAIVFHRSRTHGSE